MKAFSFIHRFPVLCLVLMFLGAVMLSVLPGCETAGTYEKSYKILSGTKVTMETLGSTAKELHRNGILDADQIAKAEEAYGAAQAVQREFITMQTEAIMSGDATKQEQAARLGVAYLAAATRFINLAIQYGIIKGSDPGITTISGPVPG